MQPLTRFSEHLARLIPAMTTADFPKLLIAMFRQQVRVDDATIVVYPGTELPVIDYFEVPPGAGASTLDVYLKGAFLLDPFYLAASRDKQFGVFRLRELAPRGFKSGQYYKTWYRNCGYQDECGYLVPIGPEGFVNIALGKTEAKAVFSAREVATLRALRPAVDALCQQHWARSGATSAAVNLRAQLNAALDAFGNSLLTEREAQVINLYCTDTAPGRLRKSCQSPWKPSSCIANTPTRNWL